jgi:ribosomal protein S18 acetylase RimI-like enzyme
MRIYEYNPDEMEELLAFRNAIFTPVTVPQWRAMDCTGIVAREAGELVGFIPLQYRKQSLNARVSVPVVYENAVGVAEGKRGQGIGTRMMDAGAEFIQDRADLMLVVRGGERTQGYRFYRKSGHSDLMYACQYYLEPEVDWPAADQTGISIVQPEQWLDLEPQLLALHQRQYGRFGGGRQRDAGYWRQALEGHVYAGCNWWLVTLTGASGRLLGYLVAVQGLRVSKNAVRVYEVVGENWGCVERLLRTARRFAGQAQYVVPLVSLANPIRPLLRRMGFAEAESGPQVMARLLRPDRIWRRLSKGSGLSDTLALTAVTPHRTMEVNSPSQPRYQVRLETKEHFLARLFCCRLDLQAALDMEMVRWRDPDPGLRRELCAVLAPSDWVQWYTDYV